MRKRVSLPALKSRLNALNEEREALSRLISLYETQRAAKNRIVGKKRTFSQLHDSVVKVAIQLAHQTGEPVPNRDVSAHAVRTGILHNDPGKNKALISYFLHKEAEYRDGRLKKVGRGLFDVRK